MKRFYTTETLMALCFAACASPAKITVQERVGPPPAGASAAVASLGSLQVFSARERAPIDLNMEEYCANEYGNNASQYEKAHTGYILCAEDGKVLKKAP
jgi:hypothetical protein